jgi:hypothetical protein
MKRAFVLLLGLVALTLGPAALQAQTRNRAAVVVRFGDDSVEQACVAFDEDEIGGYEALEQAGFAVEANFSGMGGTVCRINDMGCPADDCWCQCQGGGECVYWSYWAQEEGEWRYATAGLSQRRLQPGAVDGWSWGPGSVTEAISPPNLSFEEVCSDGATAVSEGPAGTIEQARPGWQRLGYFGLVLFILGALAGVALRRSRRV